MKPHIHKVNGLWQCDYGLHHAIGHSPQKAYNLLKAYLKGWRDLP